MSPEERKMLKEVYAFVQSVKRESTLPLNFEQAIRRRLDRFYQTPNGLRSAPLTSVTSPSGGATIDSVARTAIDRLITRLEDLGLILPN